MHPHTHTHMHTPHMNTYSNPPHHHQHHHHHLYWQMAQPEGKRARRGQALEYTHTHTQMPNPPVERWWCGECSKAHLENTCSVIPTVWLITPSTVTQRERERRERQWKCKGGAMRLGKNEVKGWNGEIRWRGREWEVISWVKLRAGRGKRGRRKKVQSSICLNIAWDEASDRVTGLHKDTHGGRKWREGWKKRVWKMLFNCASHLSPHTQQLCQLNIVTRLEKWEVKSLKSIIKMHLILACPLSRKKYLFTKGVDLRLLVFPVNLCQPMFSPRERKCGLLWLTTKSRWAELRGVACHKDVAQWDIPCHSHSSNSCLALQRTAVRLATHVCLCRISRSKENKPPLWTAGVKVVPERGAAISTKITMSNMFSVTLRCFECEVKDC